KNGADDALRSLAMLSLLTGEGLDDALAFARRQKRGGIENGAIGLLLAAKGDAPASERALQLYAAARPELGPQGIEQFRSYYALYSALAHHDAAGVLASASKLPVSSTSFLRYPREWAYLQTRDYGRAEQDLRAAIMNERGFSDFESIIAQSPLRAALAHFCLGQVYEAPGKRRQAANEYQ